VYPTFWNIQNRVDRNKYPQFWGNLAQAVKEEFREKELVDAKDAYFGVLYDTIVDADIDPEKASYVEEMLALLRGTGQYQVDDPFEPRRSYNVDLLFDVPPGIEVETEELTPELHETCTAGVEIFGVRFEGYIWDEYPRAVDGLPIPLRIAGPFQWQEDPYQVYRDYGDLDARIQWPMQGFSVAFWTGRLQGTIKTGTGTALGWRETGESCQ